MGTPDFGRSVNLLQPGGADNAHRITTGTLGFSDLPTAVIKVQVRSHTDASKNTAD